MDQLVTEQKLRFLQQVIDLNPNLIFVKDREGRFVLVNRALLDFYGMTAEELLGKSAADLPGREHIARLHREDRTVFDTLQSRVLPDQPVLDAQGNRRWIQTTEQPIVDADGVARYILGVSVDVTERHQVEETVARERNLLRTLIDSIPDYIYIKDTEGRFLLANTAVARLMGAESGEDLIGKTDFDFYPSEVAAEYRADEVAVIESGQPLLNKDEPHMDPEGNTVWSLTSKIPVCDDRGRVVALVGISRDVTERRRLHQQIQESLKRRTREVLTAAEIAQEIATAPALGELYCRVVTLIKERFGYYHAQIFQLDPERNVMALVEGYGPVGAKMKAAGHNLPYGRGVVGRAAVSGEAVLAPDVSRDPDWVPHPDLPDTRGELAVPIKLRDEVLGVLDVQSDRPNALSEEDLVVLLGLAGQIAGAIESTRALEQANIFRQFVQTSAQGLGMATLEAKIVYVNPALAHLLGVERPEDAVGQTFTDYYPPEARQRLQEEVLPAIVHTGQWNGELTLISAQGRMTPTFESFFLIRDEQGDPLYLAGVITDITERKRAEALLNTRIQILDCLSDIGRMIDESPPLNEFLPRLAERLSLAFQYPDSCRVAVEFEGQVYGRAEAVEMPCQIVGTLHIGGETVGKIYVAYTEDHLFLDEESALLGDVTRRVSTFIENRRLFRRTQEALAEMERSQAELQQTTALQRAILESADYAIIATTPEGTIVVFNPAAERMLGYTAEEVIGKVTPAIIHDPQEVAERAETFSTELGYTIEPGFEVLVAKSRHGLPNTHEWTYIRKDGSRFPVQLAVTALRDAQGNITGFLGIAQDISERRRAELEMQETLQEVERLYRAMSREGWAAFQREMTGGYRYDQVSLSPAEDVWLPEIERAMETQQFVPPDPEGGATAVAPLAVRGTLIGALGVQDDPQNPLTEEELALFRAVAEQVAQALESARLFAQTQASLAESQALYQATQAISEVLDLETLVSRLAKVACDLTHARYGVVLTLDPETGTLQHFKTVGLTPELQRGMDRLPQGKGVLGEVLQGKVVRTDDVRRHPAAVGMPGEHFAVRAVLGVPLIYREEVRGLVLVGAVEAGRTFGETEERILSTFATQAAIAIENQRLFEQTQQTLADTEALYQAGRLINAAQSVDGVLDALLTYVHRFDLDRCLIALLEDPNVAPAERVAVVQAVWDRAGEEDKFRGNRFTVEHIPAIAVLGPDRSLIVDDMATSQAVDEQTRAAFQYLGVGAAAILPLAVGERLLGWFLAETIGRPRDFAAREIEALQSLVGQAAVAVQSVRYLQEAQIRAEELTILNELGQALTARQEVTAIVENLYTYTARLMDLTSFYVALYDAQQDLVSFPLYIERGERHQVSSRRGGQGLTEYVIRTRQPLLLEDNLEQRLEALGVQGIGAMALSWLGVPMLLGDRVLGMLAVQSYETPRLYGEHHRDLLLSVASQAAIAIENRYLFEEAQARARREQILRETLTAVSASEDLITGLPSITQQLRRLYPVDVLSLTLYAPGEDEFTIFALDARTEHWRFIQQGDRISLAGTAPGWVIAHGDIWLDADFRHTQPFRGDEQLVAEGVISRVVLPLRVGGQVIGTLNLGSTQEGAFREQDLPSLTQLADQMALALERARLLEETRTALAEVEAVHRSYLRKSWQEHLRQREMLTRSGILYDRTQAERRATPVVVDPDLWRPEMEKAVLDAAPATVLDQNDETARTGLAIPIRVRGQTIGVLGVESPGAERRWTEDDLALIEAVSDQLGQALESARLFADAQRRAERERLIGEITAHIRASTDMQDIAETTATELGRVLGTARALVRVGAMALQPQSELEEPSSTQDRSPDDVDDVAQA